MTKLTAAVLAVSGTLILAVLFVFMCLPVPGLEGVTAVNGVLDLRGTGTDGQIHPLKGEWQFRYGEVLTPEAFGGHSETVHVPSSWDSAGWPAYGCATYRLTILTDGAKPLMLYLPEISSAYALWVNGEYVRGSGTVSPDRREGRPLLANALLPISAKNGAVELVIQVSNYHFMRSGLTIPLLFGDYEKVHMWFFRTRALYCAALGGMVMAAFYHLALYILRRREKVYLLFALICALCFLRFAAETDGINQYLQLVPVGVAGRNLYMVVLFLHSVAIIMFSMLVFEFELLWSHRRLAAAYVAAGTLLFALRPIDNRYTTIIFSLCVMPILYLVIVKAAMSRTIKENRWTLLYFASLLLYALVGFVTKIFFDNILFMPGILTNIFLIIAQSLVLSHSYAAAFELVEHTNINLESIVGERTRDLQAANNAIKELIGNISHDLKTPLTAMSVNIEKLLDSTPGDESYRRNTRIAYNKNLDLQRLIQNLIEVGRIETGQNLYSPQWIPMHGLLSRIKEKYADTLESENLFFDVVSFGKNALVYADPVKIWSVFDNLIYNVLKHAKSDCVTITANSGKDAATVVVSDSGCGIPPEDLPRVFELYSKTSGARRPYGADSGMGLYIVKKVMEGCGGSVAAESEPGKGTSFILTFRQSGEEV